MTTGAPPMRAMTQSPFDVGADMGASLTPSEAGCRIHSGATAADVRARGPGLWRKARLPRTDPTPRHLLAVASCPCPPSRTPSPAHHLRPASGPPVRAPVAVREEGPAVDAEQPCPPPGPKTSYSARSCSVCARSTASPSPDHWPPTRAPWFTACWNGSTIFRPQIAALRRRLTSCPSSGPPTGRRTRRSWTCSRTLAGWRPRTHPHLLHPGEPPTPGTGRSRALRPDRDR